jgi:uncharacterized protein (DUF885 family)
MSRRLCLIVLAACSSAPRTSTTKTEDAARFEDLVSRVTGHLFTLEPARAVGLGHHELDGVLPDRSPEALARLIAQLEQDRAALEAQTALSPQQAFERDVLAQEVRRVLFDLVDLDVFRTNPMAYNRAINLDAYIIRDYAPLADRAAAVIKLCTGLAPYLARARANLKTSIPRTWIETALLQTRGYIEFVDEDVRDELAGKADAAVGPALDACKAALAEHAAWLEQRQPQGTTAFALGEARYLEMLRETQGVDAQLATLVAIADADLRRNLAAMEEAARELDPGRPVAAVVHQLAGEKPAADQILAVATEQAGEMRAFLTDHEIVSIPSDEVAIVRESPPFMRWNAAFLNSPGPFERLKLPSYYYISPPDPKWPLVEQQAYIMPRADLLFVTIHELWPGHFLHGLHVRKHPSKVLQSFCTYSNNEGWAHYAEEMMFDAGVGQHTPQARIGMLKEALLRNVRFVAALALHTRGMTVEQAQKLFQDKAFVDPGNARQQAVRGTFDPMYLSYTLGKLMIRKLAAEWMKRHPGATRGEFHDALLSHACAPLPLIRRSMLGAEAGPPL